VAGSFGAKEQGPAKFEKISGIFGVLLGCLEWLVPNRNYFSETEGPATILPTTRDRVLIYKKLGGFFVQFVRFNGTRIISQWYNPWTGSMGCGPVACSGPRSIERGADRKCGDTLPACGAPGTAGPGSSPTVAGEDKEDKAVHTRAWVVAERRRDEGE
jgi:hypothetical protein